MCFDKNCGDTLAALADLREKLNKNTRHSKWFSGKITPRTRLKITGYASMNSVEEMSTSVALVLASEYDRQLVNMEEPAPLFDPLNWDPNLLFKLQEIGFFRTFGTKLKFENVASNDDLKVVPFFKGRNAQTMAVADQELQNLVEHVSPGTELAPELSAALLGAIGEAIINVREHAYISDHEYEIPHVGYWWATGAASKNSRKIQISLFDQGVTIPISYPKLHWHNAIMERLGISKHSQNANGFDQDAELISAATRYGNSARNLEENRQSKGGTGLPQMKKAIEMCGKGSLLILSRAGKYKFEVAGSRSNEELANFDHSIGGTLVEWTVELPGADHVEHNRV